MAEKVLVEIEVDESGAVKDLKKIEVAIKGATLSFDQLNGTIQEQEKITADFRIELGKLKEKFSEVGGSGTIAGLAIEKRMISLNTAINDNVQSVKKLRIDKAQSQETIKGLEAQEKAAKGLTKELKKTKGEGFDLIKGGLNDITNGAVTSFGKIKKGAKIAVNSFGLVKTAVISTGIGALVIVVASLIAFFVKTEKGAKALKVVFAGIGAVVEKLTDVFVNIGEAIFNAFSNPLEAIKELIFNIGQFALNPVAAFNKLGEAAKEFGKEIVEDTNRVLDLQKSINKLAIAERELGVERSESRKEFEKLRSIGQDVTKSAQERIEALQKAEKIESDLLDKELAIAKQRVINSEIALDVAGNEEEALDDLAAARIKVNDLERASDSFVRESNNIKSRLLEDQTKKTLSELEKIRVALIDENVKEVVAVEDKYAELIRLAEKYGQDTVELERLRQGELDLIRQEQALKEQEAFFKRAAVEIETKKESESAIDDIINSAIFANVEKNERELQSDKDFAKFKVDLAQQVENMKLNIASQAIGAATSLAREGSALAKGLAVAQVTFDTIRGIQSTFATQAANVAAGVATGGAWPYIQAASAAAFGFANVSKILSTPLSGGGGGGSSSGGGASGPSAPSVSQSIGIVAPNQGQQGIGQQIQDGLGGATIRAYAVGQDISNQQQLDRQIASNGSFG
jgi:hypothetical protein